MAHTQQTRPNQTSGFLLYLAKEDIHILDLTVEEGAKLVIAAGLVVPDEIDRALAQSRDSDGTVRKFLKKAEAAQRKMMGGKG